MADVNGRMNLQHRDMSWKPPKSRLCTALDTPPEAILAMLNPAAQEFDPFAKLPTKLTKASWCDESDDETDTASDNNTERVSRPATRASAPASVPASRDSSVASLRSTTNAISRRRSRNNRGKKGKAAARASDELTAGLAAVGETGPVEGLPLTRSAASELALILEGVL